MKSVMALNGMLLCRDLQLLCVMNRILDDLEIETVLCMEDALAVKTISERMLDCAILDWDEHGPQVMKALRDSTQNGGCFAIVLVNNSQEMKAAFQAGATLTMQKPLTPEHALRCMRAAYGSMIRQRRSAFREMVKIPVQVRTDGKSFRAVIRDLSIGGLSLETEVGLKVRDLLQIGFPLPETEEIINTIGRVVWIKRNKIGVKFSFVRPDSYMLLKRHLDDVENEQNVCNVIVPAEPQLGHVIPRFPQQSALRGIRL